MRIFKFILIAILSLAAAGCSKHKDVETQAPREDAWVADETLRVPIQFGSSSFTAVTKTMIDDWVDMDEHIGIFALNLGGEAGLADGSYDIYLNNEPAYCVADDESGKNLIQFEEKKFYPYSSDRNLTFVGYYPYFEGNVLEYDEDVIKVPVPMEEWGKHDIMYSSSFAERMYVKYDGTSYVPAEKDVDATAYYDGYNATYMRYLYRNSLYEHKMPHLHFQHKTTCLLFEAFLKDEPMGGSTEAPIIQSIEITGPEIYDAASLVVARKGADADWTGELQVTGNPNSTLKIGGQNATDLEAVPDATGRYQLPDYQFFLQPMSASSKLSLKIVLENPVNNQRMEFTADVPKVADIDEFKAGHYYPFKITVNYFIGIEVSASIEPWIPGWTEDREDDAIGEDKPSGTL